MKYKKVAAYTGTRNLYSDMVPAIKSLLINSDVEKIYLLIEDDFFPEELPKEVEVINVSQQGYFNPDGPNMTSGFTYMALMRSVYFDIFPTLDRILSLDIDTIVDDDISEIWDLPIGDGGPRSYYFAAAREPGRSKNGTIYTNIGVTLYNLAKLRNGKGEEIIKKLNQLKYTFMEQDCFNWNCQGHILNMPSCYNVTKFTDPTDHPKIIHFAGQKNWSDEPLVKKYRDIPWSEIRKPPEKKPNKDVNLFRVKNRILSESSK